MNVIIPLDSHPFLTGKPKRLLIDGRWVEAASGKTFDTLNYSGLHLSVVGRALISLNRITLGGITGCAWLTLHDFGCRLDDMGLQSSAPAHARWD